VVIEANSALNGDLDQSMCSRASSGRRRKHSSENHNRVACAQRSLSLISKYNPTNSIAATAAQLPCVARGIAGRVLTHLYSQVGFAARSEECGQQNRE